LYGTAEAVPFVQSIFRSLFQSFHMSESVDKSKFAKC
jgi:hypothetical protein